MSSFNLSFHNLFINKTGLDGILPSKEIHVFKCINVINISMSGLVIWGAGCFIALLIFIVEKIKSFLLFKKE